MIRKRGYGVKGGGTLSQQIQRMVSADGCTFVTSGSCSRHRSHTGHWLERSWPAVFKCSRLSLTDDCKDEGGPECECRDDVPGQGLL